MSKLIKHILLFTTFIFGSFAQAQILNPVKWSTNVEQVSDSEYDLVAKAKIDRKWHLYAQNVPKEGPLPTVFTFVKGDDYELVGGVGEEKGRTINDPVFNMRIKFFENSATFRQRIKILGDSSFPIEGEVEYMVCDDRRCLPPKYVNLYFDVEPSKRIENSDSEKKRESLTTHKKDITRTTHEKDGLVTARDNNNKKNSESGRNKVDSFKDTTLRVAEIQEVEKSPENVEETKQKNSTRGLWSIFIIAFLSGFAALLTPCVFPMIPLTVSFFVKQSKNKSKGIRNAIFYGVSIIVIYVLLGTVVTGVFGADTLNVLATNVWFNLIFFLLLVVFAISFLGAFEITLPNSWANKVDSQSNKSGIVGIFFMALALAIVSFSCTGPIVGTLLVEAASKGGVAPIVGMLGFSLAIALPFALFAAFPGWLNSLPKSGGWLNTVKVVLGFLELALAFKFLSQADLVLQLHLLEREVFLAIWIAIFWVLALYLFGKIQLPHDSPLTHISVGRLGFGLLILSFTIYLIPGLWGAPLNLISAFPPPQEYSESPYGVGFARTNENSSSGNHADLPEGAHLLAPHDIMAFNDYDKGLTYAKKINKPVLLDFTGWACVNCRKMEQNVWPKTDVLKVLKNDVVLVSLYVDDKRKLNDDEITESKLRPGKKLRYIGQKWSELQTLKYKTNSQPFYVLMNHDEQNLIDPVAYIPDAEEFHEWLSQGIDNYKHLTKG